MNAVVIRTVSMVVLMLMVAACGAQPEPTATPAPTEDTGPSVAMLADVGGLEDGSFNTMTFAGLSAISSRRNLELIVEEATDSTTYQQQIEGFAAEGHDVIVTVGFQMTEATLAVAADNPDISFIGIDQFQAEEVTNITGIIFPDDEAGYLAGVLAANLTESGIVGGVFGPQSVPPVAAFAGGYELGAQSVNPDIEVLIEFHPGGVDVGFNDIPWGGETATAHMEAGADVVFAAAGDTGNGALVAVANRADEQDNLFCIGVDTDQWMTVTEARPCLVTSAVKNIPQAVDAVIAQVLDGVQPPGNFVGPVGLADFHDFENEISDELAADLERIAAELIEGTLETGYSPG
ncbi:MAG: BMP family ABC transporter substrate-binding protein [Chloroflexota bacterium]